ncbi:MAG: c-type cytochrome [Pirellulales bacterium]
MRSAPSVEQLHRSPVDIAVALDESWLVSANRTSGTMTLVSLPEGKILDELFVGLRPTFVALAPDGKTLLVSAADDRQLVRVSVEAGKLQHQAIIEVGFDPHGIVFNSKGTAAYVALPASHEVVKIDLTKNQVALRFTVGKWPRYLALTSDDAKLVVGQSGDGKVAVINTNDHSTEFTVGFNGMNLGHMRISDDDRYVYFPWLHYGDNVPSPGNIRRGWVLGNRLGRVRIDEDEPDGIISLDTRGNAVSDAWGTDITPSGSHFLVTASGTHELLVLRAPDLEFHTVGSTEHIDDAVLADKDRFFRIPVGGRPLAVHAGRDNQTVYLANDLRDSIQIVDLKSRQVTQEIHLGGPQEISLVRKGEAIFYDGDRSFDRWYSCHSCHFEGGTNSQIIDTLTDGSSATYKTVLPLWELSRTSPWTWHGWQQDPRDAMQQSFTKTMQGKPASEDDVTAILAYFNQLKAPPSPYVGKNGQLSAAAIRGKKVFNGSVADCASCHSGTNFTDGEVHDLGLGSRRDRYEGYNTPSLIGLHTKLRFLHHGRAKTLEETLTKYHAPEEVTGNGKLTDQQQADLIEYLKTL